MATDKNRVDCQDLAYQSQVAIRHKIATVLAGTEAMRAAGELYLPKHTHEDESAYQFRLNTNALMEVSELTLNDWVGRPFAKPVIFDPETTHSKLVAVEGDIDLQGTDAGAFLRRVFRTVLSYGIAHVMVDYPKVENRESRTLEDDQRDNLRPYWVHIEPSRAIFAHVEIIDNREILTHLRILDEVTVLDGFIQKIVNQIRVYERSETGSVTLTIWQEDTEKAEDSDDRWFIFEDAVPIDFPEIPFYTFYASREGFMLSKIPLLGLVNLNVKHWQISSDVDRNVSVANFPILGHKGGQLDPNTSLSIGPMNLLHSQGGEFYYIEHTGATIQAGQNHLDAVERRMGLYGAEFLRARPGMATVQRTATESFLEYAATISPLQDIATRFKDWVSVLLAATSIWLKLPENAASLKMSTDFSEIGTDSDMQLLIRARELRDISRKRYLEEYVRRGILKEDFDFELNSTELSNEPILENFTVHDATLVIDQYKREQLRTLLTATQEPTL